MLARARLDEDTRKEKEMRTRSLQSSRADKTRAESEVRRDGRRVAAPTPRAGGALSKTGESPLTEIEWFLADFDQLKLKIPYRNLKFGQNKSCRKR